MKRFSWLAIGVVLLGVGGSIGFQPQAAEPGDDEAAIRAAAAAYEAAYQQGDAKALAALWSPDAEYVNPTTGLRAKGREAIEAEFARIFANGAAKLEVTIRSIRFVTPDVAVEDGSARVTPDGEATEESTYLAIHVKRNGKWLLDSVRETDLPRPANSNHEQLQELEWLVGTWVDADEEATIETTCQWARNHNFLTRTFKVIVGDRLDREGTQVIGWDAANGHIRSWAFDSDGGFAEGVWTRKGNRWAINSVGTLPDGGTATSINFLTYIDDDTLTWETTGREVDGEILPNVDPVTVTRVRNEQ